MMAADRNCLIFSYSLHTQSVQTFHRPLHNWVSHNLYLMLFLSLHHVHVQNTNWISLILSPLVFSIRLTWWQNFPLTSSWVFSSRLLCEIVDKDFMLSISLPCRNVILHICFEVCCLISNSFISNLGSHQVIKIVPSFPVHYAHGQCQD